MCLGMNPDQLKPGQRCASTSNRNFEGRQGFRGPDASCFTGDGGCGGDRGALCRRAEDLERRVRVWHLARPGVA